jgi:hypothetical protein
MTNLKFRLVVAGVAMVSMAILLSSVTSQQQQQQQRAQAAPQPTAPVHLPTAAEQCAAVSGAIENCEAILSGRMSQIYSDNSKLNYGASDPRTGDTSILNPTPAPTSIDQLEAIRLQNDVNRAEYNLRVERRNLERVIRSIKP